jgi:hypothetical protein
MLQSHGSLGFVEEGMLMRMGSLPNGFRKMVMKKYNELIVKYNDLLIVQMSMMNNRNFKVHLMGPRGQRLCLLRLHSKHQGGEASLALGLRGVGDHGTMIYLGMLVGCKKLEMLGNLVLPGKSIASSQIIWKA